ncbi:epidermal growth factor receptor kinase substrate 8-like protein 3 isoform X6 [Rhinoderma darwinii]|uniref:epidermal growth factor receptor kinase substrate 8-like protein 3 isoform X6 n=1 Tax=Rhinoderma darwinii TaxID=43563 RepID=UPI003F67FC66
MDQDILNAIDGVLAQHVESTKPNNFGSRPSAKSIYNQRKEYAQSLSKADCSFYHRVEHLLTCDLDNSLRNVQDCLKRLCLLNAEGKVWGQEMILQVQNEELILTDLESRESLESIQLQNIENCRSVMGSHPYNSLFVVTIQNQENTSILLFQSEEHPANTLQINMEKALSQWKEVQKNKANVRYKPQNILIQNEFNERSHSPQPILSLDIPESGSLWTQTPEDSPISQRRFDHGPLIFHPPSIPIKKEDTGRDIILSKCQVKNIASSVLSPFLTQRAILLLSSCVTDKERKLWQSLGDPWLSTREDWPNGKNVPRYIPTFSDGWNPPEITSSNYQPEMLFDEQIQQSSKTPPTNRHFQPLQMKVAYDFEARNERELSVKKGDRVKVLDQSRQWWMVENAQEQRGFVPNNIMEGTNTERQVRIRAVTLQQSSTPEEVTEWLQDKGFSRITVRCLGVLRGDQLLDLSRDDLKAVCPEEGGRVYSRLNEIRASVGI